MTNIFLTYNMNYFRLLQMKQEDIINEAVGRGIISAIHMGIYRKYSIESLARFVAESIVEIARG